MNNILSLLDNYTLDNANGIAMQIVGDFRKRWIEKNLACKQMDERVGVVVSNHLRFDEIYQNCE